jgi:hypothetical protein
MISQRLVIPAMMLILGCVVAPTGCSASDTAGTPSSAWVTFQGRLISLELPSSFKGGDPADPKAIAELEQVAARNPDPALAASLHSWLAELPNWLDNTDVQLVIWGEPNADGYMPYVEVTCELRASDASLEAWIESSLTAEYYFRDPQLTVESLTKDRAYVVLRALKYEGSKEMMLKHYVFRVVEDYVISVCYSFDDESNTTLQAVFRASAETIVIRRYDEELPRSDAEGLGST